MNIKIKYHGDVEPLQPIEKGDWIDLRISEDVELHAGEVRLLPLGVSMELPDGYEALVIPRSSTFKHWGILQVNSVGLIDNSYCGDDDIWLFPALATRSVLIEKNSRICQFRVQKKMESVNFVEVNDLKSESRGGFGTTGVL